MKIDETITDAVVKKVKSEVKKTRTPKRSSPKTPKIDKDKLIGEITEKILEQLPTLITTLGYVKKEEAELPKHVLKALQIVAKSDYKRFTKWTYAGLLGHLETIIDYFDLKV